MNRKAHWEQIYHTKNINEFSWYQAVPRTSLDYIQQLGLPPDAKIIDIGGGDSFLVDHLLDLGYHNITVLDISETAIERAEKRLGERATKVTWISADVIGFQSDELYDLWHDRAAFHFLTEESEINSYVETARSHIRPGGSLIMGTFSESGPTKCSGVDIKQYSAWSLTQRFQPGFEKLECQQVNHTTPTGRNQNFTFCGFRRIETA